MKKLLSMFAIVGVLSSTSLSVISCNKKINITKVDLKISRSVIRKNIFNVKYDKERSDIQDRMRSYISTLNGSHISGADIENDNKCLIAIWFHSTNPDQNAARTGDIVDVKIQVLAGDKYFNPLPLASFYNIIFATYPTY